MKQIKTLLVLAIFFTNLINVVAQVKVGNNPTTIDNGSILEIESTTKAFVPPRMTTAQMNTISTPLIGAIIYNTDENCLHQYRSLNSILQWVSLCSGNEIITVKLETNYTGTIADVGSTKILNGIEATNTIDGGTFNDATNEITLPAGTYNMIFVYDADVNTGNPSSTYISSYFFDFPNTTGIARIHSNQPHKGGILGNHGGSINYVGTFAAAKTFTFHIGRGQSGNYTDSSNLYSNTTFFSATRILK